MHQPHSSSLPFRIAFFIAMVLSACVLAGCGRKPEPALSIGTNVWIGSEPLYLARELGHLGADTARLVEYPSASEVLRAFRNQALDGMVISLDELLVLASDDQKPKIVLVIDVSHGADVVLGRGPMHSMHDLKGKRVAVETGALGAYMLSRALAVNDMKVSDVEVVHLESNEHLTAFRQGRVDGSVTFDPFRSQMLKAGATTVFDSTRIPGEIVDLLVVRASVLEKNPKAVKSVLAGWFKAIDYLNQDPKDAARRMGVRQQTSGEQFLVTLQGLRFPSRDENLKMLSGAAPPIAATASRLMGIMLESKLLRREVAVGDLLAPGPLETLDK